MAPVRMKMFMAIDRGVQWTCVMHGELNHILFDSLSAHDAPARPYLLRQHRPFFFATWTIRTSEHLEAKIPRTTSDQLSSTCTIWQISILALVGLGQESSWGVH